MLNTILILLVVLWLLGMVSSYTLGGFLHILLVLAVVFGVASLVISRMFRPHRPNPVKLSAYESGNDPVRLPKG